MLVGQLMFSLPGTTFVSIAHLSDKLTSKQIQEVIFTKPIYFLLVQGGGTFGALAATLVAYRALNKKQPSDIGLKGPIKDLFFGLALGTIAMSIAFFILLLSKQITINTSFKISTFTFIYLFVFILVGIFEEVFFRGYIMRTMEMNHNHKATVYLISALIFSVFHAGNPNVSLTGLLNIVLVGILFAYMFDVTRSLLLPIGYHIMWNFFQGGVFGFPVSGIPPEGIIKVDISHGSQWLTGGSFGVEGGLVATLVIVLSFIATYLYSKNNKREHIRLV